jgi:hypothetical protein
MAHCSDWQSIARRQFAGRRKLCTGSEFARADRFPDHSGDKLPALEPPATYMRQVGEQVVLDNRLAARA